MFVCALFLIAAVEPSKTKERKVPDDREQMKTAYNQAQPPDSNSTPSAGAGLAILGLFLAVWLRKA
jgi:hypothetical protein